MPFSKLKIIKNKIKELCHSPSNVVNIMQDMANDDHLPSYRKRVYLFSSLGSVTVEAALCMGAFMICVFGIVSYGTLINSELSVEKTINNVALETAKLKYYVNYEKKDSTYEKVGEKGYLSARVWAAMNNNNPLVSKLVPIDSNMENDHIDVRVSYLIKEMFTRHYWPVTQRAKAKDWTGVDIKEDNEIVFITKYGRVYHRSKECSHLIVNIEETTAAAVKYQRNEYGKKYSRCTYCARKGLTALSTVFVTTDGDKYHADLGCGGLTRNIIEINIKEVGNKKPCSECG